MKCTKYIPENGNKFYNTTSVGGYSTCIKGKPIVNGLNVLCNCVGWACSRYNQKYAEATGYKGMKYPSLNCNAENFIERAKNTYNLEISDVPSLFGILVFQKGTLSGIDGAGHVMVIEYDYGDGETYDISESGYNSFDIRYRTVKKSQNFGMGSAYKYIGCIINAPFKNIKPIEPSEPTKSIDDIAKEVIQGKWGNYPERKTRLESSGYNYAEVQNCVNEILKPKENNEEYYKIVKGDNLTKIAKKYNTTVSAIMKLNPKIKDKNVIYANDTIRVK